MKKRAKIYLRIKYFKLVKKIIPTLDVFHTAHKTKISGSKDKISYTKNKNKGGKF